MNREQKLQMLGKLKALQQLKQQRQQPAQATTGYDPATDPTNPENAYYMSEDDSAFDKFKHGLARSALETGLGIKGLFTDLSENDKAVLKMMKRDAEKTGGWGTAGNITGEVAQLAIPASKLSKATKLKNATRGRQALATIGAESALGGAHGALKAPEEGKDRLDKAKEGAMWGAAGAGTGQLLSKAMRGVKQSEAGKYLTDLGVRLTPGQAAEGGLPRALEYTMGILPGTAKSVARQKKAADETFSTKMLEQAAPPGGTIKGTGHEGMKELRDSYKTAYRDAWGKAGKLSDDTMQDMMVKMDEVAEYGTEAVGPLRRLNNKIDQYLGAKTTKNLDTLDDQLRQEIRRIENSQYPNVDMADALEQMRGVLRSGTSKETQDALRAINSQYGKFKAVERAAGSLSGMKSGEGLQGGVFGGEELASAVKGVGKGRQSYGEAPLQTEAKAAMETLARKEPVPLMNYVRGVSKQLEIPGTGKLLDKGSDIALGRTATQKQMREIAEMLRQMGLTSGVAGIAYGDE